MAKKKITKKSSAKKSSKPSKKKSVKAKGAHKKKNAKPKRRQGAMKGPASVGTLAAYEQRGLGARSGGQSGDTQGLSESPDVDSESVEELVEEGQSFEAEVMDGIENVPDADEEEVRTKEVPEDDVPEEYREKDRD